jgi:hypothetical protein
MNDTELTGKLPEAPPPRTMHDPVGPEDDPQLARRNTVLALALWAISATLFLGTLAIAFIYLALD